MKRIRVVIALALAILGGRAVSAQTALTSTLVASGYGRALFVTHAPKDTSRLFIVGQDGQVWIIKNGTPLATPFLNIDSIVRSTGNEQGLLGLAFRPDYDSSGYLYVYFTREPDGFEVLARYKVSADPDIVDHNSRQNLIVIPDFADNHNGGMIGFHPFDGYLYIGVGDGGSAGDPGNRAQNLDSLDGKILRIDVDTSDGYRIPPTNPFANATGTTRKEIWAYGVRNPWRWCFDQLTGDMWIADVGQASLEEIDFEADSVSGGRNYGWRRKEGTDCYNPGSNCDLPGMIDPITQYVHTNGRCSITGGYVYRGCAIPDLQGAYFYGDYCTGEIWSIRYDGATVSDSIARKQSIGVPGFDLVSFGEDAKGELYIVRRDGDIRKIVPSGVPPQKCPTCCIGVRGNADGSADEQVDVGDLAFLVDHLFVTFVPLPCDIEADMDLSGGVDIGDLTLLVDYLFISFNPLPACP